MGSSSRYRVDDEIVCGRVRSGAVGCGRVRSGVIGCGRVWTGADRWRPSGIPLPLHCRYIAVTSNTGGVQVGSKWDPSGIQVIRWRPSGIQVNLMRVGWLREVAGGVRCGSQAACEGRHARERWRRASFGIKAQTAARSRRSRVIPLVARGIRSVTVVRRGAVK